MTTRNIAPREDGEGNIGTQLKRWLKGWFNSLDVAGGNVEVSDVNGVGGNVSTTKNISVGGNLSVSGTATGVTPALTDNSTKFATTEFVNALQRFDVWLPSKVYMVGDIVKSASLPLQYCLVCTASGTSDTIEPSYAGVDVGDDIVDGTVTWVVAKTITSNDELNYLSLSAYDAANVITSISSYFSSVSGTVKVIGEHLAILDLQFTQSQTIPGTGAATALPYFRYGQISTSLKSLAPCVPLGTILSKNGVKQIASGNWYRTQIVDSRDIYAVNLSSSDTPALFVHHVSGIYWI